MLVKCMIFAVRATMMAVIVWQRVVPERGKSSRKILPRD